MPITLNGNLDDWTEADRLDRPGTGVDGYKIYGRVENGQFYFAVVAPADIQNGSFISLNTDRNGSSGPLVGGGEFSVGFFDAGGTKPHLYDAQGVFQLTLDHAYVAGGQSAVEFALPAVNIGGISALDLLASINGQALPFIYSDWVYTVSAPVAPQTIGSLSLDGSLVDWTGTSPIASAGGYSLSASDQGTHFVFAISSPNPIDAGSTIKIDIDRNIGTGDASGADYAIKLAPNLTPQLLQLNGLFSTPINSATPIGLSEDQKTLEIAVAKADIGGGSPAFNLNFAHNYSPAVVVGGTARLAGPPAPDAVQRIAIVYSETTAPSYFEGLTAEQNLTIYSQLIMAAQHQAMMAGIPFDLLSEADLTNIATLQQYDTLVFPAFSRVPDNYQAIAATLTQASDQYGVGFVTAGDFMTNNADGTAIAGDSYAIMKSLLGVTRIDGSPSTNIDLKAVAGHPMMSGYAPGEIIHQYANAGTNYFGGSGAVATTLATQTVNGVEQPAILATQTGGSNVHFATQAFLGDNNLLWQAIDWSSQGATPAVSLSMSRGESLFASRTDMDQAQEAEEVNPADGSPGIYDKLLPILSQWKADFNFVGSYYVDIGDGVGGQFTDWNVSGPLYQQMLAMGNEIGSHSVTHFPARLYTPENNSNALTPAQIQYEFETSRNTIAQQLGITVTGAAVPGAPETISTSREILKYYDYLTGGWTGIGSGYPGAFGFLTPGEMEKVYIAPNVTFDFTRIGFLKETPAQATAAWNAEFAKLTGHAATPIVVWPWHDYGPTLTEPGYSEAMFTDFIRAAYQANAEFVTLDDLASRIEAFQKSQLSYAVSGNLITATLTATSGKFALDLTGHKIQSVAGWYAYDEDSVFVAPSGGTYQITTGTALADATHISKLPMRAELVSVTGDGTNLDFTVKGEGKLEVSLKDGLTYAVTGATGVQTGDKMVIDLGTNGGATHTVSVKPGVPTVPTYSITGGGTVDEGGAMTFTVTRDIGTAAANVAYTLDGTATSGADFTAPSGTVAFAAGEISQTITIQTSADTVIEPDETIALTLTPATGIQIGAGGTATGTIVDKTTQVYSITNGPAVNEGGDLFFTVTRSATGQEGTVSFALTGTATANDDYTPPASTTVSFLAGETEKQIVIATKTDAIADPNETVIATLAAVTVGIGTISTTAGAATGTILDATQQSYSITGTPSVNEGGDLTFTVTRTVTGSASSVDFTLGGTATGGSDYTLPGGNVSFGANDASATLTIKTLADNLVEGSETVIVNLTGFNSATGTIIDVPPSNPGGGGGGGTPPPDPGEGPVTDVPGTSGRDRFVSTEANEHFFGEDGTDSVVYAGPRDQYVIVVGQDGKPASISGPGGNDLFSSIERLEFDDGVLAFDPLAGQCYRLYEAAFDRQPDTGGLSFWVNLMDGGAKNLVTMALDFLYSQEFTSLHGDFRTLGDQQVVEILYRNILDREGEAAGIDYWTGRLDDGLSREHLLAHFSESAENQAVTNGQIHNGILLDGALFV
jgi:peptidoglycan/xylan/chitin deacetylase (PgdA/CDA1 family)